MINLPESTEFNTRIPKKKFYENLDISSNLKQKIVERIKVIWWRNKIAPSTLNIEKGKLVDEIEVFEIQLHQKEIDEAILKQMDKEIPYHIIFLLEYNSKYQAWVGYKEEANKTAFKVVQYFHTEWLDENDLPLKLEGLSTDNIYANFVTQIAGDKLDLNVQTTEEEEASLKKKVEASIRKEEIDKQIKALEGKLRKEKQFNRQVEINKKIKGLRKELESC